MKIPKSSLALAVASLLLPAAVLNAGELVGGSIDTEKGSIELIANGPLGRHIFMGRELAAEYDGVRGSLFTVSAAGTVIKRAAAFKDRAGVLISLPSENFDKVVYLDSLGYVRGGVGLSKAEMDKVVKSRPRVWGDVSHLYSIASTDFDAKLEAVRLATDAFANDMMVEDQVFFFHKTIEMLSGRDFSDAVKSVADYADIYEEAESFGRLISDEDLRAPGIYLVAEGDNGGVGTINPIAEGDNGGVGTINPIAEGDNGGVGIVDVVVQGFSEDFQMPMLPRIISKPGNFKFMLVE